MQPDFSYVDLLPEEVPPPRRPPGSQTEAELEEGRGKPMPLPDWAEWAVTGE